MKETLYRFLGERNPRAKARYEALRQAGAPRWKAAPALLLPGGGGARPLPVGAGESGCGWRRNAAPGTRSAAAPAAGK